MASKNQIYYCSYCGSGEISWEIPQGDDRERAVCKQCEKIHYQNPKPVVGCLAVHEDKILLCKRSIEPRKNFWTVPSGFMENYETAEEGAARESWEEAYAEVEIVAPFTMFSLPHINQLYLLFLSRLLNPDTVAAGPESLEVQLFREDEVPWDEMAFKAVTFAMENYYASGPKDLTSPGVVPMHLGSLPVDTPPLR